MPFVASSVCVTSCHTQLFIHKLYQARKPGFAGRERPKPSEAWKTGSGFKFDRPEASKSWAADPAFRPHQDIVVFVSEFAGFLGVSLVTV